MTARILIVDDNELNLRLLEALLQHEGYDVRTAADAQRALDAIETVLPDLVLMDVQLPGMDGIELTRRIKADPRTKDVPVLAVTAYAMKGDDQRALEAGCVGYVTKPIDTRALPGRIADILAANRS